MWYSEAFTKLVLKRILPRNWSFFFSKFSGGGYLSDRSASTNKGSTVDSLTSSVQNGKQWNQNRAYFLRTGKLVLCLNRNAWFHIAKMREKQKNSNSPLAKFLPGGSLSSDSRQQNQESRQSESSVLENEMIEQLQLELEEARRTIRSHEGKILQLQEGWRSFWSNYDSFLTHLLTGSEFSHALDFKNPGHYWLWLHKFENIEKNQSQLCSRK